MLTYALDITAVVTGISPGRDPLEPNDDPASATAFKDPRLSPVMMGGLTLHDGLNEDWFSFPLGATANIEVKIIAIGSTNTIDVELLDSGLNVLDSGTLFSQVLSPGDYFIRVYPLNCFTSSYALEVSEI